MNAKRLVRNLSMAALVLAGLGFLYPTGAWAHCDTMSGPVISDAKYALEAKKVDPVLKWIRPQDEEEIRSLFDKTLEARKKGEGVQELVDMHFFETLVRVHRAGEGAPYTGLKPADTPVEPGIEAAEEALQSKSDSAIVNALQSKVESSVHERFQRVIVAAQHKDDDAVAGREYVEAYVDYIHYIERLHEVLSGAAAHGHATEASEHAGADRREQ